MRRVLAIAQLNLLEIFRDRAELVGVIVLPLLLTFVFGTAFGSGGVERPLEILVDDQDGTAYSKAVIVLIDDAVAFDAKWIPAEEARATVRAGDAPVAVVIPKGFGAAIEASETATVEVVHDPASQRGQAALEVVRGAAMRVATNVTAARAAQDAYKALAATTPEGPGRPLDFAPAFSNAYSTADDFWYPEAPIDVEAAYVQLEGSRAAELEAPANTQYSVGFTVFFVFMVALGSAGGVLEDRELGTLRRVLAAPARRAEVLGGKVLGVALVAAFEAAILVGLGAVVFGVPWGSDPLAVAVMLLALILAATGLGVMVSALVRTRSQMSAIGPVLSTALAMLGGCYWPIEITSPTMQAIAKLTPTGWAVIGLKDVVARGLGLEAVLLPAALLLGFAAVTIAIGVTRLRLE